MPPAGLGQVLTLPGNSWQRWYLERSATPGVGRISALRLRCGPLASASPGHLYPVGNSVIPVSAPLPPHHLFLPTYFISCSLPSRPLAKHTGVSGPSFQSGFSPSRIQIFGTNLAALGPLRGGEYQVQVFPPQESVCWATRGSDPIRLPQSSGICILRGFPGY